MLVSGTPHGTERRFQKAAFHPLAASKSVPQCIAPLAARLLSGSHSVFQKTSSSHATPFDIDPRFDESPRSPPKEFLVWNDSSPPDEKSWRLDSDVQIPKYF